MYICDRCICGHITLQIIRIIAFGNKFDHSACRNICFRDSSGLVSARSLAHIIYK